MIRAVFLTLDPQAPSARVRVLDHLPGLARRGVTGELVALAPAGRGRRRQLAALAEADVVVLHRVLLGEGDLVRLRRAAPALALDVDDAVAVRPGGRPSRRLARRLEATLSAADLVVCGSAALRDQLASRHPRVRLVAPASPTGGAPRSEPGPFRLVWSGTGHTLPYLEGLAGCLREVARQLPELEVVVLADRPPALPGLPVRYLPWSLEAEERALAAADVGLYPLPDDPWARGKCAYKLRRYMAFGLPAVASPHGGGREALEAGGVPAGLVADGPAAWVQALVALAREPARRVRLGRVARLTALGPEALPLRTRALGRALREAAEVGRRRTPD